MHAPFSRPSCNGAPNGLSLPLTARREFAMVNVMPTCHIADPCARLSLFRQDAQLTANGQRRPRSMPEIIFMRAMPTSTIPM